MIVCEICGYETKNSLQSHLNHKHKLVNKKYLEKYPNAQIYSQVYCDHFKYTNAHRDPSYKKKLSENTIRLYQDSDWVEKHNKILKEAQNTPEAKINHKKGALRYFKNRTKEQEELHKKGIIKFWKDENKRDNRINALKKAHNKTEVRKKHSQATKKFIKSLSFEEKQKRNLNLKKVWAKPENREKILKIAEKGLQAAMSPKGRINFHKAQESTELRKKRSDIAIKRMMDQPVIISLNIKFNEELNKAGLFPLQEYKVGQYLVDFCFPEKRIIIEIDGDYWHANPSLYSCGDLNKTQQKIVYKDRREATYCKNHDWILIRFWEEDINKDIFECIKQIQEVLYESER